MKKSCEQNFIQNPVQNGSRDFERDKKLNKHPNENARIGGKRNWKAAEKK